MRIVEVAGEQYTLGELANIADCMCPDNRDSPGAQFLVLAASLAEELIEEYKQDRTPADCWNFNGEISDCVDAVPSIYTQDMWQQFVELGAWHEDPSELGSDASDMQKAAGVCLYMIAERLVRGLVEKHGPYDGDESEED